MTEPILQLHAISKQFPGVKALDNVQFDVRAGEVHALLGENGAGKSTLIKIMSGVHQPDSGTMQLDGQPIIFSTPREAQANGIATIYQELSLYPELTVAENIFMGHAPRRTLGPVSLVDWRTMEREAQALLASLEIHDLDVRRKVGSLNIGNRQRVEIAKALSINARVLIMDEPTAALTEADVMRLFAIVRNLRERGVGIVYISHRLIEVFTLADRVTVLRDGQYIDTRPVRETSDSQLVSKMVGRTIDNLYPKLPPKLGATVLQVRDLYREPYTRGISFEVRAGEIVGLAGLVGSGRSETAQVIFGTLPAQRGAIAVNGRPVRIRHPADAIRLGIAYVPEDRATQGLVKQMAVRENASLAVLRALSRGSFIKRGAEKTLAQGAIERLNIRAYSTEQIVGKLSGGNQQKVVVSKWLASQPKLLIMDEPTRGVDVGAKAEIHRLMSGLAAEQGLAILMISSELPEILGMSDRILVMRDGRLVAEYTRDQATQESVVSAMMGAEGAA
ncbi:MAG: sugar ABC transporter ATP-binding protein, partial [Armatimonadetes bacterium]|nr:sugar ABC transporter ATP-binding protein [Anaerolineae bacterium]